VVVVAVFTISALPFRLTFTVNFSVALAPLAKSPTFHTTVPPAPLGGALEGAGDALRNVVPCGTASLTNTPLPGFGPRLLTMMVSFSTWPGLAWPLTTALLMARSATPWTVTFAVQLLDVP